MQAEGGTAAGGGLRGIRPLSFLMTGQAVDLVEEFLQDGDTDPA